MLKTDVFVWLIVNCKSLNFCLVDTLSAQLHCHMDYLFIATTRTVHTSRTAVLHAILSFLISLFAVYYPQSHKILQFYCFQILLSKKVEGHGTPGPPGFATSAKEIFLVQFEFNLLPFNPNNLFIFIFI